MGARSFFPLQKGFTLIELVTVIVLLGAISIFALPRMMDRTGVDAAAFEQELRAALRHGRALASASGCEVQVRLSGGMYGVYLRGDAAGTSCGSGGFTQPARRPVESGAYEGSVPGTLTVSDFTVTFDGLGRSSGATVNVEGRTITVSAAGYVG
ncbi:prepilin-type N-terminal cleavage/methylation domain-containing protein [Thioalkalivibrio denitrificans]|uniref:Prepilin-type N-terminal cleavage/methylation domain-containing protein n=1 Tax=Thioalkalivibrio denitrificans TaxID=108003 RepID=A0A1V3NPI9_9GAMM|nr:type II secretion system protein [Thioalkalivibrio denitrificans]OOG26788.1 prepilin-type N-terminal cleavage/methylation domain-containing protein [Thioalkalivibrio denitrificans]